jgi:ribosomal protein L37AE/L43A
MIKGKELELNDGGISKFPCPSCKKTLHRHISGKDRYFCKYCGKKYEKGRFVRVPSLEERIKKLEGK